MTRPETAAEKAAKLVGGDRQIAHGDPASLFETIGQFWEIYLRRRRYNSIERLRGADVAAMFALFKIARTLHGAPNNDDWIDAAGYASIGMYLSAVEESRLGADAEDYS